MDILAGIFYFLLKPVTFEKIFKDAKCAGFEHDSGQLPQPCLEP